MTPTAAARILSLVHPVTERQVVRAAFAIAVRMCHPDHGLSTWPASRGPPPSMEDLKKARDVLLAEIEARARPDCPDCRGSGWVAEGFKKMRCRRGC
jgi:hypothetical protein